MAVSAAMVKELRDRTGLGMMECKKALNEANGDIELAIEELRKSSGMKAAKKAGRTAADGVVATKVAEDGSYAVVVEVNSETDFVARDDGFLAFVDKVANKAFADKQDDVAALMAGELEEAREALREGVRVGLRRGEDGPQDGQERREARAADGEGVRLGRHRRDPRRDQAHGREAEGGGARDERPEAFAAVQAGASALKLFPAEAATPAVLKAQRAVLPKDLPILVVGGINPDNMAPWVAAGANGFGLGSALYKPGATAAQVSEAAQAFLNGWNATQG